MIRKLRVKLILASMISLLLVLSVIFGIIGVINYRKLVRDADGILTILSENDGSFPIGELIEGDRKRPNDTDRKERRFSPEMPYESRYFSVFLTDDGNIVSINTGKIAPVDTTDAVEYAQSVYGSGRSQGFVGDYRYNMYKDGNEQHIIFLDYGREMNAFRTFVFTSVVVSAVGMLAVMILLFFLSGRIVKPFSESYEKQKRFITDAGHELKTPPTVIDADEEVLKMRLY